MKVEVPVIDAQSRSCLRGQLDEFFSGKFKDVSDSKHGDLNRVIQEVLADRDVFSYLVAFLPKNQGLWIGETTSFDDTTIYHHYGLALNLEDVPRGVHVYNFRSTSPDRSPLSSGILPASYFGGVEFPCYGVDFGESNVPTVEGLVNSVNMTLRFPKQHLVQLFENQKS
ncbi:MAG: hypothetical protein KC506_01710 [Nanoarchaeota archaeon]|nr:hypothetical protein [Nanoarchaeota archaeon]